VRVYDTSAEDDAVWEFGLGCNGVVHVLFERIQDAATRELLDFLAERRVQRKPASVATVIAATASSEATIRDRLLFDADGVQGGGLAGSSLRADLLASLRDCFVHGKTHLAHLPTCDVLIEWVPAPVPVVVFGAGHDAQPFVRFAKELGWNVTVADGRANYATRARFPEADDVVILDRQQPLRGIAITRETIVVMMTHNYPQDVNLLEHILPAKPRYLGLLGPQSRATNLLEEVNLPVTGIDLHAPVGLDLGGDSPESIALAMVAEIQAVLHERSGGMLRHRQGSIHAPVVETGTAIQMERNKELATCDLS
jgi:xanthine/CO dehydrogenase XdhC/CoxF family maturation factor